MSAFGGETDIKTKLLTKDEARRVAANIVKLTATTIAGSAGRYWFVTAALAKPLPRFAI
jgi:hypothetical protein